MKLEYANCPLEVLELHQFQLMHAWDAAGEKYRGIVFRVLVTGIYRPEPGSPIVPADLKEALMQPRQGIRFGIGDNAILDVPAESVLNGGAVPLGAAVHEVDGKPYWLVNFSLSALLPGTEPTMMPMGSPVPPLVSELFPTRERFIDSLAEQFAGNWSN